MTNSYLGMADGLELVKRKTLPAPYRPVGDYLVTMEEGEPMREPLERKPYYAAVVGDSCHHKHRTVDGAIKCLRWSMRAAGYHCWPPRGLAYDNCGIMEEHEGWGREIPLR